MGSTRLRLAQHSELNSFAFSIRVQLIRDLCDPSPGAGVVASLARSANAHGANGVVADVDRNTAAKRNHVSELALWREFRSLLGALRPIERRTAERPGRVRL